MIASAASSCGHSGRLAFCSPHENTSLYPRSRYSDALRDALLRARVSAFGDHEQIRFFWGIGVRELGGIGVRSFFPLLFPVSKHPANHLSPTDRIRPPLSIVNFRARGIAQRSEDRRRQ